MVRWCALIAAIALSVACTVPGEDSFGEPEPLPGADAGAEGGEIPADSPDPGDDLEPQPAECGVGFVETSRGCEVDPSSRWDLAVVDAMFTVTKPNGGEWDFGNGLPDGYVRIDFGHDELEVRTPIVEQNLAPVYGETLIWAASPAQLRANFRLRLLDDDPYDITGDDVMGDCFLYFSDEAFELGTFVAQDQAPSCPRVTLSLSPAL